MRKPSPSIPSPQLPSGAPMTPQHEPFFGPGPMGPGPMGPGHGPGPGGPPPHGPPVPHPGGPPGPQMMPPFMRRHTPTYIQPDHKIYELNKRLQQRTEDSDNLWWDAFATEFFEDDATLTLTFCLEDGPKRYTIGRTLIPRYFRSIFEGGVTELYYHLRHPKESFHNTTITLDCDHCTMVTHHGKNMLFTKVCTEGRMILEFTFDDLMRIRSWHMAIRNHREFIPRSMLALPSHSGGPPGPDPALLEQLSKNITRQGLTNTTLNYLRLCVILEPMQELMCRHKAYSLSPRDCLKTTLFQKWQRMVAPPETQRPANKRRKRKGSSSGNSGMNPSPAGGMGKKKSPGPPNFSLASQDVMVVGEPSLMGGEFGDEDERLITRLENAQFEAANGLEEAGFDSPMTSGSPWHGGGDRTGHGPPMGAVTPTSAGPMSGPHEPDIKKSPSLTQ
ncbi:unnamed protein product [Darwinula stevensoni]|uniref:LIM interaction domain-containing protein n=1 Tax=Darwinula stevensoni TaxID=69355 RepID=A0A7R8XBX7_9CRUS|nr:unnamed protein product [Darwinula stevensoni]CAG0891984.1 unnamed protein product [Darwinula stevensoni]